METASHIFMECAWAQLVWFAAPLGLKFDEHIANGVLFKDWLSDVINNADAEVVALIFSICYCIWHARNKLCFEQLEISVPQVISKAISSLQEFNSHVVLQPSLVAASLQNAAAKLSTWTPPPINCYKLNVDAAGPLNDNWGVGAIIRNNAGEVMAAGRWMVPCLNNAAIAEALALRTGLQFALDLFLLQIQAETDSYTVAAALNSGSLNEHYLELIVHDCKRLRGSFSSFNCSYVRRNANQAAHGLAKSALAGNDRIWIEEIPDCISKIISHDVSFSPVE